MTTTSFINFLFLSLSLHFFLSPSLPLSPFLLPSLSFFLLQPITEDDIERVCICLRVLSERNGFMNSVFGERSREALAVMLSARQGKAEEKVRETLGQTDLLP